MSPQGMALLERYARDFRARRFDEIQHRKEEIANVRAKRMEKRVKDFSLARLAEP